VRLGLETKYGGAETSNISGTGGVWRRQAAGDDATTYMRANVMKRLRCVPHAWLPSPAV